MNFLNENSLNKYDTYKPEDNNSSFVGPVAEYKSCKLLAFNK